MSNTQWTTVTRANPCPSCGKHDWCSVSADGKTRMCRRQAPDGVQSREHRDKNGVVSYLFDAGATDATEVAPRESGERVPAADVTTRDAVYTAVINALEPSRLSAEHEAQLLGRGFTASEIQRLGYFSYPSNTEARQRCVGAVRAAFKDTTPESVPGFYREGDNAQVFMTPLDGLAIPVRDIAGRIVALRVRVVTDGEKKYLWLTGPKTANTVGSSPGALYHVPLHDPTQNTEEVRVTEGEFKADIATAKTGVLTVSVPGVGQWGAAIGVLRELRARRVRLAFDSDARKKPQVALALQHLAAGCAAEGWEVMVETWPSTWKGIDDVLVAAEGGAGAVVTHSGAAAWEMITEIVTAAGETVDPGIAARSQIAKLRPRIEADPSLAMSAEAIEAAAALRAYASPFEFTSFATLLKHKKVSVRPWNRALTAAQVALDMGAEAKGPWNPSALPQVIVTKGEAEVADEVISHLAVSDSNVYQRGGGLVRVAKDSLGPRIETMPRASVREWIARHVLLAETRTSFDGDAPVEEVVRLNVPQWLADAIASRGTWDGIRPLLGVVENAILRADGTVLTTPGYDPESELFLMPNGELPRVPERPSNHDVLAAKALLDDIIADFPFESDAHRSTWLAALLTGFARPAIDGPVPLHAIDGNLRGTGKTLLAEILAIILFGRSMPRRAWVPNAEEMNKTLTSIAVSNPPVVLFDNVTSAIAGSTLEMMTSGDVIEARLFGRNDITLKLRLTTLFLASGNNLVIGGDMVRRVLLCRLSSPEENPETRSGFRHPHLVAHVRAHRTRLAAAALTLLRAYIVAGRPRHGLSTLGTFEAYSALVRETLVFHGYTDPVETREDIPDPAGLLLKRLIEGWSELYPKGESVTINTVLIDLRNAERRTFRTLIGALEDLGNGPLFKEGYCGDRVLIANATVLAKRLDVHRDRVVGGRVLRKLPKAKDGVRWQVVPVGSPPAPGDGGDGGDGGDDPNLPREGKHNSSATANELSAQRSGVDAVSNVTSVTDEEFRP